MILLYVLFILFGVLMLLRPDSLWMITESWKSDDATEPSTIYIWSTRFGGVMFTLLGVVGMYTNLM